MITVRKHIRRLKSGEKTEVVRHTRSAPEFEHSKELRSMRTVEASGSSLSRLIREAQDVYFKQSESSRSNDDRKVNKNTFPINEASVNRWKKDTGASDLKGIDTPKKKEGKVANEHEEKTLKDKIREFGEIDAPYSDIQGIAMVMAMGLNKSRKDEIEDILLLYYNKELNINEAHRFILDEINKKESVVDDKKISLDESLGLKDVVGNWTLSKKYYNKYLTVYKNNTDKEDNVQFGVIGNTDEYYVQVIRDKNIVKKYSPMVNFEAAKQMAYKYMLENPKRIRGEVAIKKSSSGSISGFYGNLKKNAIIEVNKLDKNMNNINDGKIHGSAVVTKVQSNGFYFRPSSNPAYKNGLGLWSPKAMKSDVVKVSDTYLLKAVSDGFLEYKIVSQSVDSFDFVNNKNYGDKFVMTEDNVLGRAKSKYDFPGQIEKSLRYNEPVVGKKSVEGSKKYVDLYSDTYRGRFDKKYLNKLLVGDFKAFLSGDGLLMVEKNGQFYILAPIYSGSNLR